LLRVQGAWIPDPLIQPLVDHICKLPKAPDPMMQKINDMAVADVSPEIRQYLRPDDTQGFLEAVKFVIATGKMGVSYLQRSLHISYNRAAEYMDLLRERGVIKN
jgi:DNA segregation ATPase FtsK/SpoIIIE-like protein